MTDRQTDRIVAVATVAVAAFARKNLCGCSSVKLAANGIRALGLLHATETLTWLSPDGASCVSSKCYFII